MKYFLTSIFKSKTMAKKYHEREIRKLTRTGKGSMCVTIPIEDLRELERKTKNGRQKSRQKAHYYWLGEIK
jgi:3,4-dihydroxy-2-butanone 4-phosphate synthase